MAMHFFAFVSDIKICGEKNQPRKKGERETDKERESARERERGRERAIERKTPESHAAPGGSHLGPGLNHSPT
jgi:hypothetical protein